MVHLPVFLGDMLFLFAVTIHGQRKLDTLHLQLAVASKIEKEIIEKLVGSLWHRLLLNHALQCVRNHGVRRHRVGHYTVHILHLTALAARRRDYAHRHDYRHEEEQGTLFHLYYYSYKQPEKPATTVGCHAGRWHRHHRLCPVTLKSVQKYNFISIYFLFCTKNITFATNL